MVKKLLFYILVSVLLSVQSMAQSNTFHTHYITQNFQSLVFLSDTLLVLEQGNFPLLDEGTEIWSQKNYYSYRVLNDILHLESVNIRSDESSHVFDLPFYFNANQDLCINFSTALKIHPNQVANNKSVPKEIAYTPVIQQEQKPSWLGVDYNSTFRVSPSGDFIYHGNGNITKIGKLSVPERDQVFYVLNSLPKESRSYKSAPIMDGATAHLKIENADKVFQINGSVYNQPLILQELYKQLDEIIDSLSRSIVQTDQGWIDASKKSCLFWYSNHIISYQEIPWVYLQWGGRVSHNLTVIDTNVYLCQQQFDYVIYVDDLAPGIIWSKSEGIFDESANKRQRKRMLKTISKALNYKSK